MFDLEFRTQMEQQYRQDVLYPQAARRQQAIEELRRIRQREAVPHRGPRGRLGRALISCGLAVATLGQRLEGRAGGAPSPSG
jgi:hypothetical protein